MVKVYLETKDERLTEITIDEFVKNNKVFAFGKINKSEAIKMLENTFKDIYKNLDNDKINTIILETKPSGQQYDYKTDYAVLDLLQDFIIYYAEKLNDVLCQKVLNPKYVRATGNPAVADILFYGMKKETDKIIIKSFIFGSVPTDDEFYVATTCGTGGTSVLFNSLKELVADKSFNEKQYNKIKYVHLESIEKANTINFYTKLGFYKTNNDSKKILQDMIKNIYNKDLTFEEYVRQTNLNIGGSMYWSPDKKILKKLKCSYVYEPELWYKNIIKLKKEGLNKKDVIRHFFTKYEELRGAGMPKDDEIKKTYDLHAVIVHKPVSLENAFDESRKFIKDDRSFYRETNKSFRFRNIPKQKFQKNSFRSKKIDDKITLVYGKLK